MEFGPDWNPDCWFNLKNDSKEPARASGETTGTQLEDQSNISNVSAQPTQNIKQHRRLERAKLLKRNKRKQKIQQREHRKLIRRVEEFAAKLNDCQPIENIRTSFTRQQRRLGRRNKRKQEILQTKYRKLIQRMQEFAARFTVFQPSQQHLQRALLLKQSKGRQRIQQTEHRKLNRLVMEFAARLTVCECVPLFFGDSGKSKPVEEIAKGLVGQYLICRESHFVLRILETEAYVKSEPLYLARFRRATPKSKTAAGTLLSWLSVDSFDQQMIVLTTGDYNSGGDVVLLRSCEIIGGLGEIRSRLGLSRTTKKSRRANQLLRPETMAKALLPELTGNCNVLDASKGICLMQKESANKIILQGKRVLPKDTYVTTSSKLSELPGAGKEYRFALSSRRMKYEDKSQLHRSNPATSIYRILSELKA